ncbi:phage major capsid protein [Methylocystis sp. IM3]
MRRRRGEILDEARALTEKGAMSASDQKEFDRLMAEADELGARIGNVARVDELDGELSQKANLRTRGGAEGSSDPDTIWRDTKTGDEIRALKKGESLAARYQGAAHPNVTLGDCVRAMLAPGTATPDVRAALSEGIDTAGGFTVPETLSSQIIDKLRAEAVCTRAGAITVPMDAPTVYLAKLDGDPTASWRGENATISESSPAFARVTLSARSLATVIKLSRELAEDSANLDATLRNALAKAFALELDRAALFGNGVAEPLGVVNWTGINTVSLGTDGAALSGFDNFLDGIYEMHVDNAGDPTAAIMAPRTEKTINKMKDGDGETLVRPPAIANLPFLVTTSVPVNQTQGISTDCSSIIMGDFSQLLIGMRTQLQIQVLRERFADNLQLGLLAYLRADVVLTHPESFTKIVGIKP